MINILDKNTLKQIFHDIESDENRARKRRSWIAYDIYNNNQHRYVMECLCKDYPDSSVDAMRNITSINFARRVVDVEANVYKHAPRRMFETSNDESTELLENIYEELMMNNENKMSNRFYKMDEQCAFMFAPNRSLGRLGVRKLQNWQYDVVPDPEWPDQALAYVIPLNLDVGEYNTNDYFADTNRSDYRNQIIADKNDKDKSRHKYIVWTKDYNFMANGDGVILTDEANIENPIGRLPIVDISAPKGNSFILQNDNNLARFTVDFLCQLSDIVEIVRMQGFSQAVLTSVEKPKEIMVGPRRILWLERLKKDEASKDPTFQFTNPNPDLQGTLDAMQSILRMFLTSRGHKTGVVTGGETNESFSSGIERLMSMVQEHDSSLDDFMLFESVEQQQFDIIKKYNNYLQDARLDEFELKDSMRGNIDEDALMNIEFHEPQMLETEIQRQQRLSERLDNGTLSRWRFIMEMDGISEEEARERVAESDGEGLGEDI